MGKGVSNIPEGSYVGQKYIMYVDYHGTGFVVFAREVVDGWVLLLSCDPEKNDVAIEK